MSGGEPSDGSKPRVADEYEVDPDRNDGANYQYHNVVRGRDERRKMHGGDCECCREVSRGEPSDASTTRPLAMFLG